MQYLLLIYNNESESNARSADDKQAMYGEYGAFTKSIIESGNFKAGDALQPVATATTVRVAYLRCVVRLGILERLGNLRP